MSEDWAKGLSDGLVKNTSLTTLSLTINSIALSMSEDWLIGPIDGLTEKASLTTLRLKINISVLCVSEDWAKGRGDGMAKNTSLTTLSQTFDSSGLCISEDWARQLGVGLAKGLCNRLAIRASGSNGTLIVNSESYSGEEWETYSFLLSKSSPSFLVTLGNDRQLLKRRNWKRDADLEECTLASVARDPL